MRSRTVLITGAGGFIGRRLVPALCQAGWKVIALVRPGRSMPDGIRTVELDLETVADRSTFPEFDALDPKPEVICHLAALIPPRHQDPESALPCFRINALAALRLATWAARSDCRFVYTSTANLYAQGGPHSPLPAAEHEAAYPASHACFYLTSKLAGELFVEHVRCTAALPAITLRFTSTFGPGMPQQSGAARFLTAAATGKVLDVWGGGTARYDFVYVDDVVAAVTAALTSTASGLYNIGSGRSHSLLEFARMATEVYADAGPQLHVRPVEGHVDPGFRPVSIRKAQQAWGYAPRSLVESIREFRRVTGVAA